MHNNRLKVVYPSMTINNQRLHNYESLLTDGPCLAPELLAGKGHTPQSDNYAVGGVIHKLYTGSMPFQATTGKMCMKQ